MVRKSFEAGLIDLASEPKNHQKIRFYQAKYGLQGIVGVAFCTLGHQPHTEGNQYVQFVCAARLGRRDSRKANTRLVLHPGITRKRGFAFPVSVESTSMEDHILNLQLISGAADL